jgi:hypothetical protein
MLGFPRLAQAPGQGQARCDVPGRLAKHGHGIGMEIGGAVLAIAVEQVGRAPEGSSQ